MNRFNKPQKSAQPKRPSTIKDVAAAAGVSIATVSNVLHGNTELHTPQTVAKVRQAAEKLGYRPNLVARSLVWRRTRTLGVILQPDWRFVRSYYLASVVGSFLDGALRQGYHVKIGTYGGPDSTNEVSSITDGSVDGVAIVAPDADTPILEWAKNSRLPVVIVGSFDPGLNLPCVSMDDYGAAHEATKWLISQGHRRIGWISGPQEQWSARHRDRGYEAALKEAGISPCPAWRYPGDYVWEAGRDGIQVLLKVEPRPTAVLCSNIKVALGALEALRLAGVSVPAEMSLMGIDDVEAALWTQPPLATWDQPMEEIGMKTAEKLIELIESDKRESDPLLLPGKLIVRESVAPLA